MQQRIPLGGGRSPHAVRRGRRGGRVRLPAGWPLLAAALGITGSLAGVLLAVAEPPVEVGIDARGYRVAGQELSDVGGGVYRGAGGGVLVIERRQGQVRAAASADLDGRPMTGRCTLPAGAGREDCVFRVAGREVGAVDTRTAGGWHRRYADGRTVEIRVAGDPDTPVPFAVGR